jgi:hypothetical protein
MSSRIRRANNNSVTFQRTGPTSTLGDKTKTFGLRLRDQGARGRGKTIQTSSVNPNNMGQAPCCAGQPPLPPCPGPKEKLVCPPSGVTVTLSVCTQFADLSVFPNQQAGVSGGSALLLPSGVRVSANPTAALFNYFQIFGAPAVNPATEKFCICFQVQDQLVDAQRGWLVGLAATFATYPVVDRVLVASVPLSGGGPGFQVLFEGVASFASPIVPAATASGLHSFRLCGNETPGSFSLQVDNGTPVVFVPPVNTIPVVGLQPAIIATTVGPPLAPGPSIVEVRDYCLQAG